MGVAIKKPGTTGTKKVYKHISKAVGVQVVHISAAEGDPSTFWMSKSGKYYLTKAEAEKDKGKVVNPDDYKLNTSFLKKYRKYILAALIGAIVVAGILYAAPKIAAKFKK